MNRLLPSLLILLAGLAPLHAQLDVTLQLKRRTFIRGESIEATVAIRNLSGHDVTLRDVDEHQWFGFEVMRGSDTPVPPLNANYRSEPVTILAGESVSRPVDLLRLFPINELASYRVRAAVYFHETGKYHASNEGKIDISEGKRMWGQTVGVPEGREGAGGLREFELLNFQTPKELVLYARVSDEATGTILATYPLGRILTGATPMVEFSNDNTLYAFHMTGPSLYALSKIGINGEWLGQGMWNAEKGRATVRKKPDGTMVVVNATRERAPAAGGPAALPVPKLSDAPPVPLPVTAPPPRR